MFGNLNTGSIIYIIDKGENPSLKIAQVTGVTAPKAKNPLQIQLPNTPHEMAMSVSAKCGDDTFTFENVNPALSIVDVGRGLIVSDDKAAICAKAEELATVSNQALQSVAYHERMVAACEQMMLKLNPTLQKEVARDKEIEGLKKGFSLLNERLDEMMGLLRGFSDENKKGE